jgi:hypothetical protein
MWLDRHGFRSWLFARAFPWDLIWRASPVRLDRYCLWTTHRFLHTSRYAHHKGRSTKRREKGYFFKSRVGGLQTLHGS